MINAINEKFNFTNKVVCEIGADPLLECSRAAMLLGAKEVHSYNYGISLDDSYDDKIKVHKYHFGQKTIPDNFFDLIFAIATLEHIPDIKGFVNSVIKALKPGGNAYIQGDPLWLGPKGHHIWVHHNNVQYQFDNDTNPLDNWYHLSMPNKEQFEKDMVLKGVQKDAIPLIWESVFFGNNINRITPNEFIGAFKSSGAVEMEIYRSMDNSNENSYFEIARKSFSEEDLRTSGMTFLITKK